MRRRDLLRAIGGSLPILAGLTPEQLFALGRSMHRRPPGAGRDLKVLNAHQDRTVTLLAEMIIPETDTPGATAAGVNLFIDRLLADWYAPEDRDRFLSGLAELDARSTNANGARFADAPEASRVALVSALDEEVTGARQQRGGRRQFFGQMKWLTVYGYYTSEVGVTQELKDQIIPGAWRGCAPLAEPSGGAP